VDVRVEGDVEIEQPSLRSTHVSGAFGVKGPRRVKILHIPSPLHSIPKMRFKAGHHKLHISPALV
jgi:hypothetical protein